MAAPCRPSIAPAHPRGGFVFPPAPYTGPVSRRRFFFVLPLVAAVAAYFFLYFNRPRPDSADFKFTVPDAGFSVRFPHGEPAEEDLALNLVSADRAGGDERTKVIRKFQTESGTIRGWMQTAGPYRYGVRVHYPNVKADESSLGRTEAIINGPERIGPVVSNLPVLDEARATEFARPGRLVLYDYLDGRRVIMLNFVANGLLTLLFIEKAGDDLTLDD
jgi:hypothetical protein